MDNTFELTRAKTATTPRRRERSLSATKKRPSTAKNQARSSLENRKFHYILKDYSKFGASSPSWTIPSSRKDSKPPPDYPPPGQYDVPLDPFNMKYSHSIQMRENVDYRTITSNIDYIYHPYFPKKESIRHNIVHVIPGEENKNSFIGKSESPGPCYNVLEVQPKVNYYKKHNIGKHEPPKEKVIKEITPSPQDYNPVKNTFPRAPAYSFDKIVVSDDPPNRQADLGTPGPGAYNVGPQIKRAPRWAEKSHVYTGRKRKVNIEQEQPKPTESSSYIEFERL